ncbi:hypothetical protein N499_0519B, partial [Wolbachia pipientis wVitA]
DDTLLVETLL